MTFVPNVIFISEHVQATTLKPNTVKVFVKNKDGTYVNSQSKKSTSLDATNNQYSNEVDTSAIAYLQDNNFNPLKATNSELIEHGYPSRPTDKSKLSEWEKEVSVKLIKPELVTTNTTNDVNRAKDIKIQPNIGRCNSYNWGGYVLDSPSYGSSVSFQVPTLGARSLTGSIFATSRSSQWAGIGGYTNSNSSLIQDGVQSDVGPSGLGEYYPWFELFNTSYNNGYECEITNIPCSAGDNIFVSVQTLVCNGSNASFQFYIANTTQGVGGSLAVTITDNKDATSSAEWISENVRNIDGSTADYPETITQNYPCVVFWSAQYQSSISGTFTPISSNTDNLYQSFMFNPNSNDEEAAPSNLDGASFDVDWLNYN